MIIYGGILPKRVDIKKTKDEISDIAMSVFIEKGYDKTRLKDISQLTNQSRTSLYKYFKNKDEIFIYSMNKILDNLREDFSPIVKNKRLSAVNKIKEIIKIVLKDYCKQKNMLLMLFDVMIKIRMQKRKILPDLDERTQRLITIFKDILEEGIKQGEIKEIDINGMSFLLFSFIRAYIVQITISDDISINRATESFFVLIDGLLAK